MNYLYQFTVRSSAIFVAWTRTDRIAQPLRLTVFVAVIVIYASSTTAQTVTFDEVANRENSAQIFTTEVVESLRHTGVVAKELESRLQAAIRRLDEVCTNDSTSLSSAETCGQEYMTMLSTMNEVLPELRLATEATRDAVGTQLRTQIGTLPLRSLQETLLGQDVVEPLPTTTGEGMRLSERFKQYYRLVASSGAQGDQSLVVLASDIFLDMKESALWIAYNQRAIHDAALMDELNRSLGLVSSDARQTIQNVRNRLFGQTEDGVRR